MQYQVRVDETLIIGAHSVVRNQEPGVVSLSQRL